MEAQVREEEVAEEAVVMAVVVHLDLEVVVAAAVEAVLDQEAAAAVADHSAEVVSEVAAVVL